MDPDHCQPLLMENLNDGEPIPILHEWYSGFMKGVNLDAVGWLPDTAGEAEWMSTLTLNGMEEGWEVLEKKNLSLARTKRWPPVLERRYARVMRCGWRSAASRHRGAPYLPSHAVNRCAR